MVKKPRKFIRASLRLRAHRLLPDGDDAVTDFERGVCRGHAAHDPGRARLFPDGLRGDLFDHDAVPLGVEGEAEVVNLGAGNELLALVDDAPDVLALVILAEEGHVGGGVIRRHVFRGLARRGA
jgi:hypothetical protein